MNPRVGKRLCLEGAGRGAAAAARLGEGGPSAEVLHSEIVEKWKETVEREAREGLMFAASVVQAMHAERGMVKKTPVRRDRAQW